METLDREVINAYRAGNKYGAGAPHHSWYRHKKFQVTWLGEAHSRVECSFVDAEEQKLHRIDAALEREFSDLKEKWLRERGPTSSLKDMVSKPSYLRIIGMGRPAISLLLCELRNHPDHWFSALSAITGENPILPEHRGNLSKMAEDWLKWGRQNSYLRNDGG